VAKKARATRGAATRTGGRARSASAAPSRRVRARVKPKKATQTAKKTAKKAAKKVAKKAVKKAVSKATRRAAPVRAKRRATTASSSARTKRSTAPAPARRTTATRNSAPSKAAVPSAFARQRAGASVRDLLLFELVRARAAVRAALQGIASGRATQPMSPGKWSVLEVVLHLSERDRVRLEEFDRLLAGVPRSWAGLSEGQIAAVNEAHLAPLRGLGWDEALRRMDSIRATLMERLAEVPAEPQHVWSRTHSFGDTMGHLPEHDRHHAQQIKTARIGGRAPVED
jgi:hypothetical protein